MKIYLIANHLSKCLAIAILLFLIEEKKHYWFSFIILRIILTEYSDFPFIILLKCLYYSRIIPLCNFMSIIKNKC